MHIIKKIKLFLIVLVIFGVTFITGCSCNCKGDKEQPKKYYYVTFDSDNGSQTNMIQVEENATVSKPQDPIKNDYTFLYWAKDGVEFDFDTKITNHITLVAQYEKNIVKTSRVIWNEDEAISYIYDGEVPRTVNVGSTVKFKINVSPYYEGTLKVVANSEEINKDNDGYYSFIVKDETSITITTSGLTKQNDKISGSGTKSNPYLIENAAQFKTFIDGVNSTDSSRYNTAYFELTNDIDFNGYTLDTIGDTLNVNEFSGVFDGKNHTLSNFTLKDEKGLFGLFGHLAIAELKNLHLKTDLVSVPSSDNYNLIGSLVAYNIGSDIYNCTFEGSITVTNNLANNVLVHAGGLVGYMQSYSNTYSTSITHSYANCNIVSDGSTELTSVGGLVGILFGSSVEVPAYVYNSKYTGNIEGLSIASGGIVGALRQNTSIVECYSSGKIEAISEKRTTAAGGIVGSARTGNSVAYCFSTAQIVSSLSDETEYIVGNIVGSAWKDGVEQIDSKKVLEIDNYYSENNFITVNDITYDLTNINDVVKLLSWNKDNWNDNLTPKYIENYETEIEIKVDFGKDVTNEGLDGSQLTQKIDIVTTNGQIPVQWIYGADGMNSFTADDGTISYGYFLDEARTIRIPSTFIITKDITLYVGFADYKEVEGEYYILINNIDIKLTFDDNGKMTLYYDGIIDNCMYVYDGNKILIKEAYFAYLVYPSITDGSSEFYYDFYAHKDGNNLIIYNNELFSLDNDLAMTATKRNDAMGSWYDEADSIYTFLSDGTGSISTGETFIYECEGNDVIITIGNNVINAVIDVTNNTIIATNGTLNLSKYDIFKGVWETKFDNQEFISFDGKGKVTYNEQVYDYIIDENNVLSFGEYTASFNNDGLLELNNGRIFGREGSYIGTWMDTGLDYWVTFNGITKDGYGTGYDSNGFSFVYVLDSIENGLEGFITMYYGTSMYGYGELATADDGSEMLYLAVYTPESGIIVDDYNVCYFDSFYGIWNGNNGLTLEFNGLGAYDIYEWIYSLDAYWDVRGFVSVTENGVTTDVRYTFDRKTGMGTFEYKGVVYNVHLENGELIVNEINYKIPDGFELYAYQTDELIIEFNGKSNVGLGEVKITKGDITNIYKYEISETVVNIYDNDELIYILDIYNGFKLIDYKTQEEMSVGLHHSLIGKTYTISSDTELVLDQKFDIDGIATGKFISGGETIEIGLQYIDNLYVAMYLDNEFFYYLYFLDENCAALCDFTFSVVGIIAVADELKGIWKNENGEIIAFDGLSKATKYIDASCELTVTDETGTYIEQYTYEKQNDHYVIIFTVNDIETEVYYVYTTYQENAVAYTNGDSVIYVVIVEE